MSHDGFGLAISIIRTLNVCCGAAFAALLLRATLPVWGAIPRAERWLSAALLIYSANVTLFTALVLGQAAPVAPSSFVQIGFLLSFLAGHRALYFVRRDPPHAR